MFRQITRERFLMFVAAHILIAASSLTGFEIARSSAEPRIAVLLHMIIILPPLVIVAAATLKGLNENRVLLSFSTAAILGGLLEYSYFSSSDPSTKGIPIALSVLVYWGSAAIALSSFKKSEP